MLDIADGHQLIELLIQCHRLGLSRGRCSILTALLKYGRQMRPMNPPGDPRSYHRWSVWRPMDSLGFAENVSEWKWTDDSTNALISNVHCALVKRGPRLVHFDHFLIGCMVSADYWLADYPELRRSTQPSTIGCPLGKPGFCIFCSTVLTNFPSPDHAIPPVFVF